MKGALHYAFALGISVLALLAIGISISMIDSPSEVREHKLDQQRVNQLQTIERAVNIYAARNKSLPKSLDDLKATNSALVVADQNGTPYEYEPTDTVSYQLCATFEAASPDDASNTSVLSNGPLWKHTAGHTCFTRTSAILERSFNSRTGSLTSPMVPPVDVNTHTSNADTTTTTASGVPSIPVPPAASNLAQEAPPAPNDQIIVPPAPPSLALSSPASIDRPSINGFAQSYKCFGPAKSLGDTTTSAGCIAACRAQPHPFGCWWMDGSGGFARECRVCLSGTVSKSTYPNDWAAIFAK